MNRIARQKVLLVLLLAVLVTVGSRQLLPLLVGGERRPADASGGLRPVRSRAASVALPEVIDLRIADLQRSAGQYSPGRDPFRFAVPDEPRPRPEEVEAMLRAAQKQAEQEQEQKAAEQPTLPPAPQPPPVDVVFLGSFGPKVRPLAVFSDGREIFNVFEGGVLKDRFIVVKIGYESADLGFVGFPHAPAKRLEIGG